MAAEYTAELRDFVSGTRLGLVTGALGDGPLAQNGFTRLQVIKQVNSPGRVEMVVPGDFSLLPLPDKTLVIIRRRDLARGLAWRIEFVGVIEDMESLSKSGRSTVALRGVGLLGILDWYGVLWPAGVANRTVWTSTPAETILKTLVTYNAVAASATTGNGRDVSIAGAGVSVAADAAGGTSREWTANRSRTLLAELQALALVAGGDFDLVHLTSTTREFRFYPGQRGTDRTATAIFSKGYDNIDNIAFKRIRSTERTIALVAGEGTGTARTTASTTGANYSASNYKELFVDARDMRDATTAALQARGTQRLDELLSRDVFTFDVIQTESSYYGGSYDFGDLVTAVRPDGVAVIQQIYRVTLNWQESGREDIKVELQTP